MAVALEEIDVERRENLNTLWAVHSGRGIVIEEVSYDRLYAAINEKRRWLCSMQPDSDLACHICCGPRPKPLVFCNACRLKALSVLEQHVERHIDEMLGFCL